MLENRVDALLRYLSEVVKDWLLAQTLEAAWAAMEKENNAALFSAFLSRLARLETRKKIWHLRRRHLTG